MTTNSNTAISTISTQDTLAAVTPTSNIDIRYNLIPIANLRDNFNLRYHTSDFEFSKFQPNFVAAGSVSTSSHGESQVRSERVFYNVKTADSVVLDNGYRILVWKEWGGDLDRVTSSIKMQFYNQSGDREGSELTLGIFEGVHSVKVTGFGSDAMIIGWSVYSKAKETYDVLLQYVHKNDSQPGNVIAIPSQDGAFSIAALDTDKTFIIASKVEQDKLAVQKFCFDGWSVSRYVNAEPKLVPDKCMFEVKSSSDGSFKLVYSFLDERGIFIEKYKSTDESILKMLGSPINIKDDVLEFRTDFISTGDGIVTWKQNRTSDDSVYLNYGQRVRSDNILIGDKFALPLESDLVSDLVLAKADLTKEGKIAVWLKPIPSINYTVPVAYIEYNYDFTVSHRKIYNVWPIGNEHIKIGNDKAAVELWEQCIRKAMANKLLFDTSAQNEIEKIMGLNIGTIAQLKDWYDEAFPDLAHKLWDSTLAPVEPAPRVTCPIFGSEYRVALGLPLVSIRETSPLASSDPSTNIQKGLLFPSIFDTSNLNSTNGFKLMASGGSLGRSISWIGDVNGDGKDDLMIGTDYANSAYVVFGRNDSLNTLDITSLNGTNGFKLFSSNGNFGNLVSGIGDINGDGKPDMIVGTCCFSNRAYVIFGGDTFPSELDASTLNGTNGFILTSSTPSFGDVVAGIGDVNGDGKDDLIVGTWGISYEAYIVFGASDIGSTGTLDTSSLNGINGFKITSSTRTFSTSIAGIGDINGDGKSDVIFGTNDMGKAYVIFGASDIGSSGIFDTSSLDGTNGFTITSKSSSFGYPIAGAGDINCDGKDDLIVGISGANKAYIIFGASDIGSSGIFSTSDLNGANGFALITPLHAYSGFRTPIGKAGDVNGDGKDDLIVGIRDANAAYIIYGASDIGSSGTFYTSNLNGTDGFKLVSVSGGFGRSVSMAGDINGDGKDDVVIGAPEASTVYVIFGQSAKDISDQVLD